jgi:cytochrome P450
MRDKPLPPGRSGFPLVGETLRFLGDQFGFVLRGVDEHGPVFRTRILGRDTAIIAGPEATAAFNDDARVTRSRAMPSHVEQFFGGVSLPILDGDEHRARKQQVMGAFSRDALSAYVPVMETKIRAAFDGFVGREIGGSTAFKRLSLEILLATMLSIDPGEDLETVLEAFGVLSAGFTALPIPLPGTAFSRAIRARDRIFNVLRRAIAEHRAKPHDDGLGRMLKTKAANGATISDEAAALELHHFNIAGYLVFAELTTMIIQIDRRPDLADAIRAEIATTLGDGRVTVEALVKMPALEAFTKETKRFTPFVPVFFGRARCDFELGGHRIPEGWMVLWAHHASHLHPRFYVDPERFDPDRFNEERAEDLRHTHAYAPQGAGNVMTGHKCAGFDFATILMKVFAITLLRGYRATLPTQDLALGYEQVPPEPASGLRVNFARVRAESRA